MNAASHTFRFTHQASQPFRTIHPVGGTLEIYTPCKTNFSDCYKLQDKLFRFMHATSQTFRCMHPARQSFRWLCPAGQTLQIYTRNKTNFSDWCTLQDNRFTFILPCKPFFFRFILLARQTFQISLPCRTNRFRYIHPARHTFQIYTPSRTSVSDLYTLEDKLFRLIHATSQIFQIHTPCRIIVSDWYTLPDKLYRFIHPAE